MALSFESTYFSFKFTEIVLYHYSVIQFSTLRFGDFRNVVIRAFKFILSIQFNTFNIKKLHIYVSWHILL